MQVVTPCADGVTTRLRDRRRSKAGQQRPQEQDRRTDRAARLGNARPCARRVDRDGVGLVDVNGTTDSTHQVECRPNIPQPERHVAESHGLLAQERGRERREGNAFRAMHRHSSRERSSSRDDAMQRIGHRSLSASTRRMTDPGSIVARTAATKRRVR